MNKEMIIRISDIQEKVTQIKKLTKCIKDKINVVNKNIPKEGITKNYKLKFNDIIVRRCLP